MPTYNTQHCYELFDKQGCHGCPSYRGCLKEYERELGQRLPEGMHYVGYPELIAAMLNQRFKGEKILGVQDWTS
jgi:hypothetical protein